MPKKTTIIVINYLNEEEEKKIKTMMMVMIRRLHELSFYNKLDVKIRMPIIIIVIGTTDYHMKSKD